MSSNNEEQHADEADDLHEDYYMILNLSRDVNHFFFTEAMQYFTIL
jgi:hypothetical protein